MNRTKIEKLIVEWIEKEKQNNSYKGMESRIDVLHYLYGRIDKRIDFHTIIDAIDFVFYKIEVVPDETKDILNTMEGELNN